MVYSTKRYRCGKCRKGFSSYYDAESCEIGHIASDVISEFRNDIRKIAQGMEAGTAETEETPNEG